MRIVLTILVILILADAMLVLVQTSRLLEKSDRLQKITDSLVKENTIRIDGLKRRTLVPDPTPPEIRIVPRNTEIRVKQVNGKTVYTLYRATHL